MDKLIYDRAQSAMLSRDFALAARLFKTLLKQEPGNIEIMNALGSLFVKSGEDEKAIPYYESILTLSPHDVDAMNSLGGCYRRLKEYEKGINVLERALDENQKTAMINYTLGFTYKDMGNLNDAIDCFESVVAENPTDVLAYNHLGFIYAAKKNYPKAVQAYRRGLQTDPNHPILQYNLGHAYESERNYNEAIKCYELALKAKPGWIDAIRDVVQLLLKQQNTKRAMEIVQKSVQLYPANAELIALAGNVQLKRYDFVAAQNTFEKADRLKPNDPAILLKLSESLEKQFLPGDAVSWAKEARVLGLSDNSLKKRYVHIMLSAEEMDRAKSILDELISDSPSDAGVLDAMAQYCILSKDEEGKDSYYARIEEMNPRYRHHYLEAARRYCQMKYYEPALKYAKAYLEKAPLNPAGYNILGRIYEKMDDLENAVKTYKIAAGLKYEDIFAKNELNRLGQQWNANLQIDVSDYINQLNEAEKEEEARRIMAEEEAAAELEAQMAEEQSNEFDFGVMGDDIPEPEEHVPLLAELSEDEGLSSFDELLDEDEKLMEQEKEEDESKRNPLPEILSSKPDSDVTDTFSTEDFEPIPGWDEPMPSEMSPLAAPSSPSQAASSAPSAPASSTPSMGKSKPVDIDDFMPSLSPYTADDAMEMLREDAEEPRMDPRLVNKIDDAVENLEKAVSDVSEKADEAMRKAEEAASRIASASDQIRSELEENPTFSDPGFGSNDLDFAPNEPSFGAIPEKEGFNEPDFDAPFEMNDPFSGFGASNFPDDIQIPENPETAAEISSAPVEQALDNASQFLPNIVKMIEDENVAAKYKTEIGLFSKLRSLSDFLPAEKKEEFLSSKTRMLMDYVIGKMSGKPGLVKTVENLLKSGILETEMDYSQIESEAAKLTGKELARKVISDLRKLTADLPDQNLAKALQESADEVLKKL
ncbi:MAG: tetratricopeptide repeat protein [Treponema sp.]|nr:tetratricopeptide repeat protein [Treponema sp.]